MKQWLTMAIALVLLQAASADDAAWLGATASGSVASGTVGDADW